MTTTTDIRQTLERLLQTCIDGQNGFEAAAKAVDEPTLKAELLQYSLQRQDFASELRAAVAALGEKPSESGSVSAALHRGWMNIKTAVSSNDRYAVLAECERGEDAALAEYREAVHGGLPQVVAPIIQTQFDQVQRVHDRVRALRDAAKTKAA